MVNEPDGPIHWHRGKLLLECHIQPSASRDELAGTHGGRLKIRIKAPPADGKANRHLVKFMADLLGVPSRQISLTKGQTGRIKTLCISGLDDVPVILSRFRRNTTEQD